MIVFGTSQRVSDAKSIHGLSCKSCAHAPLAQRTEFSYFHLYWIPVIPYKRKLSFTCEKCAHVTTEEELREGAERYLLGSYELAPFPPYMFIGIVLISLLAGAVWHDTWQKDRVTQSLLLAPQVGDLYIVPLEQPFKQGRTTFRLRVLKLERRDAAGYHFTPSTEAFQRASDVVQAESAMEFERPESFHPELITIQQPTIEQLLTDGQIKQILRKK